MEVAGPPACSVGCRAAAAAALDAPTLAMRAGALLLVLACALLPFRAEGLRLIPELAPLPERVLVVRGPPPAEGVAGAGAVEMEALVAALDADQQRLEEALSTSSEPPQDSRRVKRRCFTALPEPEDAVMADRAEGHARNNRRTRVANTKTTGQRATVTDVDKEVNGGDDVTTAAPLQASTRNPRDTVGEVSIPQRRLEMLLSVKEDLLRDRVRTPVSIRAPNGLVRRSVNALGRKDTSRVRRGFPIDPSLLTRAILPKVRTAERRSKMRALSMDSELPSGISERNRKDRAEPNVDVMSVRGDVFTPRAAFVTDQQGEEDDEENSNDDEVASESTAASTKFTRTHPQPEKEQELHTLVAKTSVTPEKSQTLSQNTPSEYSSLRRHITVSNYEGMARGVTGNPPSQFGNAHYHHIAHVDDVIAGLMGLQAQRSIEDGADHLALRHGFLHRHHPVGTQREPLEAREPSTILSKTKNGGRTFPSPLPMLSRHHPNNKIANTYVDVMQPRDKTRGDVPRSRMEIMPSVRHQAALEEKEDRGESTSLLHENRQNNGKGVMLGIRDIQMHDHKDDDLKNQEAASPESNNKAIFIALNNVPSKGEPQKGTIENIRPEYEAQDNRKTILILPSTLVHKQSMGNNYHTSTKQEALANRKSSRIFPLGCRQEISADDDTVTSTQSLDSSQGKYVQDPASLMTFSNCQPKNVNEKRKGSPVVGIEGEGSLTILSFNFHPVVAQKSRNKVKNCLTENNPSLEQSKKKTCGVVMPEFLLQQLTKDNIEDNTVLTTKSNIRAKFLKSNVHRGRNELTGEELQKDTSEIPPLIEDKEKNSRDRVNELQGIKKKNVAHEIQDSEEDGFKRFGFPSTLSSSHQYSDQQGTNGNDEIETSHHISTDRTEKEIGVNVKNNLFEPLVLLLTHNQPSDSAPEQINIKENEANDFAESLFTTKKINDAELSGNIEFNAKEQPRKLFGKVQPSLENEENKIKLGKGKYNKEFRNNQIENNSDSLKLFHKKGQNVGSNKFLRKGTKENNEQPLRKIAKVNNFKVDEQSIIINNQNLMPCAVEKRGDFESSRGNHEKSSPSESTLYVQKNDNFEGTEEDAVTSGGNMKIINEMETLSSIRNVYSHSDNPLMPESNQIHRNAVFPTSLKEKSWTIAGVPNIIQELTSSDSITPSSTKGTKCKDIKEQNGFRISNEVNLKNAVSIPKSEMSTTGFIQPAKAAPGKLIADVSNQRSHKLDSNFDQEYSVANVNAIQSRKLHQSETTQVLATKNNPDKDVNPTHPNSGENQEQKTETFLRSSISSSSGTNGQCIPKSSSTKINSGEDETNVKYKTHKMESKERSGHLEEYRRKEGNHGASCHVSIYLENPKSVADEMLVHTASDKPSKLITETAYEAEENQKPCACKIHVAREDNVIKTKASGTPSAEEKSPEGRAALSKREEPSGNLIWNKEDSDRKDTSAGAQQRNGKPPPPAGPCAPLCLPEHVQRLLDAEANRAQHPPTPQDDDEDDEDMEDAEPKSSTNYPRKPGAVRS